MREQLTLLDTRIKSVILTYLCCECNYWIRHTYASFLYIQQYYLNTINFLEFIDSPCVVRIYYTYSNRYLLYHWPYNGRCVAKYSHFLRLDYKYETSYTHICDQQVEIDGQRYRRLHFCYKRILVSKVNDVELFYYFR